MVNHTHRLDRVFGALANPARRAILAQLAEMERASITELAQPVAMTLPAVMKHLDVLEDARLIMRSKTGRTMFVRLSPKPMAEAVAWLNRYEELWSGNLHRLAAYAETVEARARKARASK